MIATDSPKIQKARKRTPTADRAECAGCRAMADRIERLERAVLNAGITIDVDVTDNGESPMVDSEYVLHWRGRAVRLGPKQAELMRRMIRRPGLFVVKVDRRVCSTLSKLRNKLRRAGMQDLANSIQTTGGHAGIGDVL